MSIYDLPQIKSGIWTTEFFDGNRKVLTMHNGHHRIQTEGQAQSIACANIRQFNVELEWDRCETVFRDNLSI